jgi:probable phosphoglycerate mutase
VWHTENRYAGRSDIDLSPKGEAQARHLSVWAAAAKLSAVWSSPLTRARQTAQPAAIAAGLKLAIDERLVELDFGCGEGKTFAEMQAAFPAGLELFLSDPVAHFLPGGENPVLASERGMTALTAIAAALPEEGRALIVGHTTLIRLLLCRMLGLSLSHYRSTFPRLANATGTELGFQADAISLLSYNAPLVTLARELTDHA